jgi:hypothetical protein
MTRLVIPLVVAMWLLVAGGLMFIEAYIKGLGFWSAM